MLAASATYHLGLCHVKKGQNDRASQYFQQIIDTYPQLESTVGNARRQLKCIAPKPVNNIDQSIIFADSFEKGEDFPLDWNQGQAVSGVTYHWDREVAYQGQSSLCLEKTAEKYFPVAQWTRHVEYSGQHTWLAIDVQVKTLKATKAIVDALFLDDQDNWIRHEWVSYIGIKNGSRSLTHPWKLYSGQVNIPKNTHSIVIGLQIYGPGTVWFDDLQVSYVSDVPNVESIECLIQKLGDPNTPPFTALNRLIAVGEPTVVPLLKAMPTSSNWQIPKALGAIGDKRAVGPLIEKWEKQNVSPMKDVVAEALTNITQQAFGDDLAAWSQWWEAVKETHTPEATLRGFMRAALAFDVDKAMSYVAPDSHDYDDIKEVLEQPQHPFYQLFKKADISRPVRIVKADISDTMCEAVWEITMAQDISLGDELHLKAGETFTLDGNLHLFGEQWLITGI